MEVIILGKADKYLSLLDDDYKTHLPIIECNGHCTEIIEALADLLDKLYMEK